MRVIRSTENIYNAVDAVVKHGFAAIDGTASIACPICDRVIKALGPYKAVTPVESYVSVKNRGYLYVVVDTSRFSVSGNELKLAVEALDAQDSG